MTNKIKLQVFYILIWSFNLIHKIILPIFIKKIIYIIAKFKIGKHTSIQNVRFFSFGKLSIGSNCIINSGVYLDNRRCISIGNHVVIAHDSKIYTLGHDINDANFVTKGKPVVIEDYVIVFSNVLIMPGVTIKKGAVILPGSVVTKDVDEMNVVGGNPAITIKMRSKLHSDKLVNHYWFAI
jgi:maltose O-acetyltransferase